MEIDSAVLSDLYAYWDARRHGREMPSRADLDPVEIPQLLPHLILFEVEPETNRLRARLTGTKVVEFYGKDYTGSYLDELDLGDQRQTILDDYRACLDSGQPSAAERTFWNIRGLHFQFTRLLLPLSDDGRLVNMVLVGVDFHEVRGA